MPHVNVVLLDAFTIGAVVFCTTWVVEDDTQPFEGLVTNNVYVPPLVTLTEDVFAEVGIQVYVINGVCE